MIQLTQAQKEELYNSNGSIVYQVGEFNETYLIERASWEDGEKGKDAYYTTYTEIAESEEGLLKYFSPLTSGMKYEVKIVPNEEE